ncbi:MAG: hypothetical protein PHP07_06015, partial [Eubacteriales bacterium]|nr:hypothetical protein [Eubacteriales bacterium]
MLKGTPGSITYGFGLDIGYNPSACVSNIEVVYKDGTRASAPSRSYVVPLYEEHTHDYVYISTQHTNCLEPGTEIWRCECGEEEERPSEAYGPHSPAEGWKVETPPGCLSEGLQVRLCDVCDEILETEAIEPIGYHTIPERWEVTLMPTCAQPGLEIKDCTLCGERLQSQEIPATALHTAEDTWRTEAAASCVSPGLEYLQCGVCGLRMDSREIAQTDHVPKDFWEVETPPSCVGPGVELLRCAQCGTVLDTRSIQETGHSGEWQQITAPGCLSLGSEVLDCVRCGERLQQDIPALGHDMGPCTVAPGYCTEARETICFCQREGCTWQETGIQEALDHHMMNEWRETEASCTSQGWRERTCTLCPYTETEITADPLDHLLSYGGWRVQTPAGCESEGVSVRFCEREGCPYSQTRQDSALGHLFGYPLIYVQEQTCLQEGIYYQECQREDCASRRYSQLPMLRHFEGVSWSSVPCETGGISRRACATCDLVEEKLVEPGHSFTADWRVDTPATCTSKGLMIRSCDNCSFMDEQVIDELPHVYGQAVFIEAPACGVADRARRTCIHCSAFYDILYDIRPHLYGPWTPPAGFSCEEGGTYFRVCSDCGEEETKDVEPGEHELGDWQVEVFSTCAVAGTLARSCAHCTFT